MTSPEDVLSAPSLSDTQIEAFAEQLLSDFDAWAQFRDLAANLQGSDTYAN